MSLLEYTCLISHPLASPAPRHQWWQSTAKVSSQLFPRSFSTHEITYRHRLSIRVRVHWHPLLRHFGQQLEVVDVVCWCVGIEELGFLVEWVGEGVWGASRDGHVVALGGVDDLAVEKVESEFALGHKEGLVMLWRSGC